VFGEILGALKEAKIDQNLTTKDEELAFVRKYASAQRIAGQGGAS